LAGLIRLGNSKVRPALEKQLEFCFTIRPAILTDPNNQKPYFISATTMQDYTEWLDTLKKTKYLRIEAQEKRDPLVVERKHQVKRSDEGSMLTARPNLKPRSMEWNNSKDSYCGFAH